jgi:hypothetical protein
MIKGCDRGKAATLSSTRRRAYAVLLSFRPRVRPLLFNNVSHDRDPRQT